MWKWNKGRQQGTQYKKLQLWSFKIWKFGFDAFILHYPLPTLLGWHRDPVENGRHWRMNIRLKGLASFFMQKDDKEVYVDSMIILFRPDIYPHMLRVYTPTWKLSFGFVIFK